MPLTGEYAPSPFGFARDQADLIERSGGIEGTDNQGKPVIVLTSVGAKTGKLGKTPLKTTRVMPIFVRTPVSHS